MLPPKSTLKAGDVVRLKSSGPSMTIGLINRNELKCFWADQEESIRVFDMQGFLPNPVILERIDEPPIDSQEAVIQPGCRVRLRSSQSPVMTVNAIHKNSVYNYAEAECVWFTTALSPFSKVLPLQVLMLADEQ